MHGIGSGGLAGAILAFSCGLRLGGDGAAEPCVPPSSCLAPWLCSVAGDSPTGSNREKLTGLPVGWGKLPG